MFVKVSSEVWILLSTRCVEICMMHGILILLDKVPNKVPYRLRGIIAED